jgi:anti-anti-sigma factor
VTEMVNLFVWERDNVVVVGVTGEIDMSNAEAVERAVIAEIPHDSDGLVIDFGGLEFMDSSGVHMLFALAGRLQPRGLGFAVVAPEDSAPRRVLELSGPQPTAWIHDSEEAAIAAVVAA